MKYFLILISCCIAEVAAYLDKDISTIGLSHILEARYLSSHSTTGHRYSKRGTSRDPPSGQRELAKGSRKAKKGTSQQGKAAAQQQSQTGSQQTGKTGQPGQSGQQSSKESGPKPSQSPKKSTTPPPAALLRAEVEITRGPADIHTVRGTDVYQDIVSPGERRRRVVSHSEVAAAGGRRRVNQPANAASQPTSQHAVRTIAQGPVAETTFRIPPGGRGHISAEVPGRDRHSWDIPGERGTSVVTAESVLPEPAKLSASVTDGGLLEAAGLPRGHGKI